MVIDAKPHTLIQQEEVTLFNALAAITLRTDAYVCLFFFFTYLKSF